MHILIAITGSHSLRTHEVVSTLRESMSLMHINLRQPIVDFTAKCLNMNSHDVEHHVSPQMFFDDLKMNLAEMQSMIHSFLCVKNKSFLTDAVEVQIKEIEFLLNHWAKGYIISNVTTESEADWVRSKGGLVIHVHEQHAIVKMSSIAEHVNDETIITCREKPPTEENLSGLIKKITNHFNNENTNATQKVA